MITTTTLQTLERLADVVTRSHLGPLADVVTRNHLGPLASSNTKIHEAAAALTVICTHLLQNALPPSHEIPHDQSKFMSVCIEQEIDAFIEQPNTQQMPRKAQASVFALVAQHYSSIYQQLQRNNVNSDWGNYELSTYHTLYTCLQAKQNDLGDDE
jgi:hypothetical protein